MRSLLAQQYLDSFINHELCLSQADAALFKLDRVQRLLKELGNPHKDLKIIHVAGSKGKGSVCALTASILQNAGYKIGLYTSPHLNHYRERIRILKPGGVSRLGGGTDIFPDCIREDELCDMIDESKPAIERVRACQDLGILSFFEVYTALALCYFHKRKVDFAVLETGLGGRLDATNAVPSIIAIIVPVSLEHTQILGDTIAQIAAEKAGIIKDSRQKIIIAPQKHEAYDVLNKRCRELHIVPRRVEGSVECREIAKDIDGQTFDLITARGKYKNIFLPLLGKHQRNNAATALCVVECLQDLGVTIPPDALREGCANVFWPGRFEVAGKNPLVLLDGAHNADSARALSETVEEILGGKKAVVVLGVSKDKNKAAICDELKSIARKMIFTKAGHPRASDLEGAVDVKTALETAFKETGNDGIILVTGSIFVVSEARRYLLVNKKMENGKWKSEVSRC